jgi:Family of unknown function (DUF5519)
MNFEKNKNLVSAEMVTAVPAGDLEAAARPISPVAAIETVKREVASWKGVSAHEHRFGGVAFSVGRRELGHLHGSIADLPFPRPVRDELIATGRARPHHVLPESGWVTIPMRTTAEVASVIELFRRNYERAGSTRGWPHARVQIGATVSFSELGPTTRQRCFGDVAFGKEHQNDEYSLLVDTSVSVECGDAGQWYGNWGHHYRVWCLRVHSLSALALFPMECHNDWITVAHLAPSLYAARATRKP